MEEDEGAEGDADPEPDPYPQRSPVTTRAHEPRAQGGGDDQSEYELGKLPEEKERRPEDPERFLHAADRFPIHHPIIQNRREAGYPADPFP